MQKAPLSLTLLCAGFLSFNAEAVSPITKVVEMISDLQQKVIGEGEEAQGVYDKFSEWCEDRAKELQFAIKTGQDESKSLKAVIADEVAKIGALENKIDELAGTIATDEADLKAATEIRAKENSDFLANEKELTEVIDTLQRAIVIIEKGQPALLQMPNLGNLAQVFNALIGAAGFNSADASRLTALVQSAQESDDGDVNAPAATVYEGHSGNIIETLQGLLDKAAAQLDEARRAETASLNNFQMLKQSLEDAIKFANDDLAASKKNMAAAAERKATAEGDLEGTTKDLQADTTGLSDLHRDCMAKAEEFEAETKSRDEELAALAKAKQIIQETTGGAAEQSYSFVQVSRSQLSSRADLANFEVVRFVRDLAQKNQAPALAQLASRISSAMRLGNTNSADVFGKVKGLIADMIAKLEKEAEEAATKKAYCDKELSETKAKEEDKTTEIAKLSTAIDEMTGKSAQLKEEVATLENELSELAKSQATMDKVRGEEKAAFDKNSAEMLQGLKGIRAALKVLRDYYGKSADHDAAQGASAGIIGLLEVCEADFSKNLAEMTSVEETSKADYERETKDNEVEKAAKEQDVKYKTKESAFLDKETAEAKSDRSGVQAELDAVLEYKAKLEGECIEKAETYEERKTRREAELAGLRQALNILENEAALVQRSTRHTRRHASFLQPRL